MWVAVVHMSVYHRKTTHFYKHISKIAVKRDGFLVLFYHLITIIEFKP